MRRAGQSQEVCCLSLGTVCLSAELLLSPPFHHSWMSDGCSVQGGCFRFSRCCHLLVDLPFHGYEWKVGQATKKTDKRGFNTAPGGYPYARRLSHARLRQICSELVGCRVPHRRYDLPRRLVATQSAEIFD